MVDGEFQELVYLGVCFGSVAVFVDLSAETCLQLCSGWVCALEQMCGVLYLMFAGWAFVVAVWVLSTESLVCR